MSRSNLIVACLLALVAICGNAQSFPAKPLSLYCTALPGSATHQYAQGFSTIAARYLGQPLNVHLASSGDGGLSRFIDSSPRDGHALYLHSIVAFRVPYERSVTWHPVNDFTFIVGLGRFEFGVVVKADSKFETLNDVIAFARASPGRFVYSTALRGYTQHLVMEDLARKTGVRFASLHGTFDDGSRALAEGRAMAISESTIWGPSVDSGALRLLVTFGERRSRWNAPTARELGFDVTAYSPLGIVGPKGLDPIRAKTLHDAFNKALDDPDYDKLLRRLDMVDWYKSSEDYAEWAVDQFRFQGDLIQRTFGPGNN